MSAPDPDGLYELAQQGVNAEPVMLPALAVPSTVEQALAYLQAILPGTRALAGLLTSPHLDPEDWPPSALEAMDAANTLLTEAHDTLEQVDDGAGVVDPGLGEVDPSRWMDEQ